MIAGALRRGRLGVRSLAVDFGNRDLARLGVAKAGISFASWCFAIALGVYGFETGGAVAVGVVAAIRLAPGALSSPFAGVLGDRFPRRDALIGSGLAMAVVLALAAVAAQADSTAAVYALAGLFTVVVTPYVPAEAALLPVLSHTPQELTAANVTHSAMDNTGFLLAAGTTGVLLAVTTPTVVFTVAATAALITTAGLLTIRRDHRPSYAPAEGELSGPLRQSSLGFRALFGHPGLRLLGATMVVLMLFEGAADVLVVLLALDLLHLSEGSVGFLNAGWGFGALLGGAGLAMLVERGRLAAGLAGGALIAGLAVIVPAAWTVAFAAYAGWFAVGLGFTVTEVTAHTLLQRLGSDETLSRVVGSLESARLAAQALGSISASLLVELLGVRGALVALGALLPVFVFLFWTRLRGFEVGAPVVEEHFELLRGNSIFAPLPVATLERIGNDLSPVSAAAGEEVIVQGEPGDRFYVIEAGQVEVFEDGVFRRNEGRGESFGEIALLRQVPRTATVRATEPTSLLALDREQFIGAVTGHRRSHQMAHTVVDSRWAPDESPG